MSETIRDTFEIASSVLEGKEFITGVELEIEDIIDWRDDTLPHGWHRTEDGSLRNNGYELISAPAGLSTQVVDFQHIHSKLILGENPFSERTSIHVHVNCLDLTCDEVKSIVLWYSLFEAVFFTMVAPNRRNNIHCVGLDQTVLSEQFRRSLPIMLGKWSKYTALNMLPLREQGTIEFRHMQGHNDPVKFNEWLSTIRNLWKYGQEYIIKQSNLSPELILAAFDYIFKDSPKSLALRGNVLELVSDNIIDVKLALV